jgi:hypothetical protein
MQVQYGKSQKEIGLDIDFPYGSSGILRWMGSVVTRKSSRTKYRVGLNEDYSIVQFARVLKLVNLKFSNTVDRSRYLDTITKVVR